MLITPKQGSPHCDFSTSINGRVTSGNIVLPEAFVVNGQGVHLVKIGVNGSEYAGFGSWSQQNGAFVYKCKISESPAIRYETLITARGENVIEFAMTFRNLSGVAWDAWTHANAHVAFNQEELQDTDGSKTYVVDLVSGGLGLVPIKDMVTIPQDGQYAWQWGLNVNRPEAGENANVHFPLVARCNDSKTQWVGVVADNASTVGGNMRQRCIHANPKIGPLGPNEVKTVRGRIMLDESSGGNILLRGTLALYD